MTSLQEDKYDALEQAFDRDLEEVISKKLENGNGKGTNKKDQKHDYMTFKYSSRFRGTLHEAILLNGKPVFIKYENGQLQVVPKIEEEDRILRPPSIEEYPYEPIQPENTDFHEGKIAQNCMAEHDKVPIMPSAPSAFSLQPSAYIRPISTQMLPLQC